MRVSTLIFLGAAAAVTAHAGPKWRRDTLQQTKQATKEDWPWCDVTLGCLDISDDWYADTRPLNFVPHSRDSIGTRFLLHTRENRNEDTDHEVVAHQASTLDGTGFDASKPTKFIIHGFIDTGNLQWLKDLALGLLDYGDYNVFRVDWGGGSLPLYGQAAGNCRVVGLEIGYLVNWMVDYYGMDPATVHLLGHSLGSHISGYAGEQIPGLGRITGLDPAGPYFTYMKPMVRLDETDAVYVDNIHTDADSILMLGYGTEQAMGNIDFYPNSGHDQPGCDPVSIGIDLIKPGDIIDDGRNLVACSHQRAIAIFQDTLTQPCPYIAHECSDYESFEFGECGSCEDDNHRCSPVGLRASEYTQKERVNVKMFFDTDEEAPFCYYHYQITVHTAHPKHAEDWVQGHLKVTFYGDNGEAIENIKVTKEHERFDHGRTKSFLLKSHVDVAHIVRAEFHWNYDDTLTNPGSYCWLLLCNRTLYVSFVEISNLDYYPETSRLEYTVNVCDENGAEVSEIKSGHTNVFKPRDGCGLMKDDQ